MDPNPWTTKLSPMKAMAQWWRDWIRAGSALAELKCCGDEVERLAKDLGMSASELRGLASRGPHSADLLLQRMAALDLNRNEVSRPSLERSRTFSAFARCARAVAGARATLRAMPLIRSGRIIARTPGR